MVEAHLVVVHSVESDMWKYDLGQSDWMHIGCYAHLIYTCIFVQISLYDPSWAGPHVTPEKRSRV